MVTLRQLQRTCRLVAWTMWWFVVFLLSALPWPTKHRRDRLRDRVMHRWSRCVVRVLGVRIHVTGTPPQAGGLLVANHLSYLDIPVFASILPVSILSKADVAHWPVIGLLARAIGVQFVVREDKRSLPAVAARLQDETQRGHVVLFFPEGTSSDGAAVLPFRPALLAPAAHDGAPVHFAATRYRTPPDEEPAANAVCWWGDMTFLPHVRRLLRLPHIEAVVQFGTAPVVANDRKELARSLQRAVERLRNAPPAEPGDDAPRPHPQV